MQASPTTAAHSGNLTPALDAVTVYIVDDDQSSRELLDSFMRSAGYQTTLYASAVDFLERFQDDPSAIRCLISDICMPSVDGLTLQKRLVEYGIRIPTIFVSAVAGIPAAVEAMKCGAVDFLPKPLDKVRVLECVANAIHREELALADRRRAFALQQRVARLTHREREVMELLVKARSTKEIASELNINAKTVFVHRARVMEKMGVDSLVELSRLVSGTT